MRGDFICSLYECNGELFDFVKSTRGGFEEPVSRRLFWQMLSGMTYMHQKGFVNRDLKMDNMLVGDDYTIKIADFGFAKNIEGRDSDGKMKTKGLGTLYY